MPNISNVLYAVGRAKIPQIREDYIRLDSSGKLVGADVLGAIAYALDQEEAIALLPDPLTYVDFIHLRLNSRTLLKVRQHPYQRYNKLYIYRIVTQMNDEYQMSFDQIADWLHSVKA